MTKLKLEVGKFYRTRDGRKVGPMTGVSFKWVDGLLTDDCKWEWSNHGEGRFGAPDLIAEWTDTPEVGTLAEINAHVGDVVEFVEWDGGNRESGMFAVGKQYTHTGDRLDSGRGYFLIADAVNHKYRIVSRASAAQSPIDLTMKQSVPQSGPVQLRKVIVPGVYGRISVFDCGITKGESDVIYVGVAKGSGSCFHHTGMSRADLIAARDVFNALIDAMEE